VILEEPATGAYRVRPLRNAYAAHHARDPARFPHTPRTAFAFDPREWLGVILEAETRGEQLAWVYHSHVDTGAHFSAEDREWAAPDGEPLLPGVGYLVVSVVRGRATQARGFAWKFRDFHEIDPLPWDFRFEKTF
jgi:proteasome lid subunit RPN8/RPN11